MLIKLLNKFLSPELTSVSQASRIDADGTLGHPHTQNPSFLPVTCLSFFWINLRCYTCFLIYSSSFRVIPVAHSVPISAPVLSFILVTFSLLSSCVPSYYFMHSCTFYINGKNGMGDINKVT